MAQDQAFTRDQLESMNEKAIQNQFFTPDHVYIDMSLLKDIPIGIVYAHNLMTKGQEEFRETQTYFMKIVSEYQKRVYDTVEPWFLPLGFDDAKLETTLHDVHHDLVFSVSPTTRFFDILIRHTIRNQNNSGPAGKFVKRKISKDSYVLDPIGVTYYINTHPLTLSTSLLSLLAKELGESLGVNIQFLNKDPVLFDQDDWSSWLEKIECFYFNSLGSFTRSPFVSERQGELAFVGKYFFARKRFEKIVMADMKGVDFDHQVLMLGAQLDMMCDFAWLQNNEVRLTDEGENIPLEDTDDTTP